MSVVGLGAPGASAETRAVQSVTVAAKAGAAAASRHCEWNKPHVCIRWSKAGTSAEADNTNNGKAVTGRLGLLLWNPKTGNVIYRWDMKGTVYARGGWITHLHDCSKKYPIFQAVWERGRTLWGGPAVHCNTGKPY